MKRLTLTIGGVLGVLVCLVVLFVVAVLMGWSLPKSEMEQLFQDVMRESWVLPNSQLDVTQQICPRVTSARLSAMNIKRYDFSEWSRGRTEAKPVDVWQIQLTQGLIEACSRRLSRDLIIEIDRTTNLCIATVRSLRTCDP